MSWDEDEQADKALCHLLATNCEGASQRTRRYLRIFVCSLRPGCLCSSISKVNKAGITDSYRLSPVRLQGEARAVHFDRAIHVSFHLYSDLFLALVSLLSRSLGWLEALRKFDSNASMTTRKRVPASHRVSHKVSTFCLFTISSPSSSLCLFYTASTNIPFLLSWLPIDTMNNNPSTLLCDDTSLPGPVSRDHAYSIPEQFRDRVGESLPCIFSSLVAATSQNASVKAVSLWICFDSTLILGLRRDKHSLQSYSVIWWFYRYLSNAILTCSII